MFNVDPGIIKMCKTLLNEKITLGLMINSDEVLFYSTFKSINDIFVNQTIHFEWKNVYLYVRNII